MMFIVWLVPSNLVVHREEWVWGGGVVLGRFRDKKYRFFASFKSGNAGDPGLPLQCPRTVTRPPAVAQ